MTPTMRDRIEWAKLTGNVRERDAGEAAVYLISRFHEPPLARELVLDWTLERASEAFKVIAPRIAEAMKAGNAALNENLSKLH